MRFNCHKIVSILLIVSLSACTTVDKKVISSLTIYKQGEEHINYVIAEPEIAFNDGFIDISPHVTELQDAYNIDEVQEKTTKKDVGFIHHMQALFFSYITVGILPLVSVISDKSILYGCSSDGVSCKTSYVHYDEENDIEPIQTKLNPNLSQYKIISDDNEFYAQANEKGVIRINTQELGDVDDFDIEITVLNENESYEFDVPLAFRTLYREALNKQVTIDSRYTYRNQNELSHQTILSQVNTAVEDGMQHYLSSVAEPVLPSFKPIDQVTMPERPPLPVLTQSQFETKAEFEIRQQEARKEYEETLNELENGYLEKVKKRNELVQKRNRHQQQVEKTLNAHYQKRLSAIQEGAEIEHIKRMINEFKHSVGAPYFTNPAYDAETNTMHGQVKTEGAEYVYNISVEMDRDTARTVYENPRNVDLKLTYNITDDKHIEFADITLVYDEDDYIAKLTDGSFSFQEIQVALNTSRVIKAGEQARQKQVSVSDIPMQAEVFYPTPDTALFNRVDDEYNDDIPVLLSAYPAAPINPKRWLVVIGIEQYQQTQQVEYARRSAELFTKVAQKKLGIDAAHTYELYDSHATVGAISDRLETLSDNVEQGDEIYFYYNGHGIPDPTNNNEPYMLAADKQPARVTDNENLQLKNIYKNFTDSKASHTIAFVDSCFTGETPKGSLMGSVAASALVPRTVSYDNDKLLVLAAASKTQYANVLADKGNRLFSYYLMKEMLTEETDINVIFSKVKKQVKQESLYFDNLKQQVPTISDTRQVSL